MMQHSKDVMHDLPAGSVRLYGIADEKIRLAMEGTLKKVNMRTAADFFRNTMDLFATGEFWGKLMRASCLICSYTGDVELRRIVDEAAADMLSIQREDGCISTCPDQVQPKGTEGSDLWERKYVLMGLLAYYELTGNCDVMEAAVKLVRYTNAQVGKAPKTEITETGWAFGGMESASMLEPVMRVWHITKEPAALELGTYIVESGCCARENIFEAIRKGKSPKDIAWNGIAEDSIAKAYEMMSCFEGLAEFYRATDDTQVLETLRLFWEKVVEEEITLLGAGGADAPFNLGAAGKGEQWNRTKYEQTNPDIDLMMETCVTVYWMRLCHQLLRLTGEVKYMDELEKSLYNAILGALRPDGQFFEYFPKFNGKRNPKVNYSYNIDGFDLSCCTANGPTALGMAPYLAYMKKEDGFAVNLYENSEICIPYEKGNIILKMSSEYPRYGKAELMVSEVNGKLPENFAVWLRVPGFAEAFQVIEGDDRIVNGVPGTYLCLKGIPEVGTVWKIQFTIPLIKHPAPMGSNPDGKDFIAFTYGSILLARDERDCVNPMNPVKDSEVLSYEILEPERKGYLKAVIHLEEEELNMIDYMSAGNAWDDGQFVSWLPTGGVPEKGE